MYKLNSTLVFFTRFSLFFFSRSHEVSNATTRQLFGIRDVRARTARIILKRKLRRVGGCVVRDERRRTGWKRDGGALKICAPPGITLPASPPFAVFFFFIFLSFPFLSPMPPLPSHYRELPLISLRRPISSFLPRNSSGPSRVVNVSSHSLFVLRFFFSCFFVFPLRTTRFMTRICDGG